MEIITQLKAKIENINRAYNIIKSENNSLRLKIEDLQMQNDQLSRAIQDSILKLDSTLTNKNEIENEEKNDILY